MDETEEYVRSLSGTRVEALVKHVDCSSSTYCKGSKESVLAALAEEDEVLTARIWIYVAGSLIGYSYAEPLDCCDGETALQCALRRALDMAEMRTRIH